MARLHTSHDLDQFVNAFALRYQCLDTPDILPEGNSNVVRRFRGFVSMKLGSGLSCVSHPSGVFHIDLLIQDSSIFYGSGPCN